APPAGKPLTYFTGRVGHASCAKVCGDRSYGVAAAPPTRPSSFRRFTIAGDDITLLPLGNYSCLIGFERSPPVAGKKEPSNAFGAPRMCDRLARRASCRSEP